MAAHSVNSAMGLPNAQENSPNHSANPSFIEPAFREVYLKINTKALHFPEHLLSIIQGS